MLPGPTHRARGTTDAGGRPPAVLVTDFATTVLVRPRGTGWHIAVDVVLHDAVLVVGVLAALGAARRARHERVAWYGVAFYCAATALADVAWSALAATGHGEGPSFADALYLTGYLVLYAALVGLIKARVARFHPTMWLDGLIGGLRAAAIAVVVVLGPWLSTADTRSAAALLSLAYPLVDVVQVTVRTSHVRYLHRGWAGRPRVAARRRRPDPGGGPRHRHAAARPAEGATRVGWRVMVLPLTCNAISLALLGRGPGDARAGVHPVARPARPGRRAPRSLTGPRLCRPWACGVVGMPQLPRPR